MSELQKDGCVAHQADTRYHHMIHNSSLSRHLRSIKLVAIIGLVLTSGIVVAWATSTLWLGPQLTPPVGSDPGSKQIATAPPVQAWALSRQRALFWDPFPPTQYGKVTCNTPYKFVKMHWTGPKVAGESFTRWSEDQYFTYPFYPVDFAILQFSGTTTLIAGGADNAGNPVLSVRTLGFSPEAAPEIWIQDGVPHFAFNKPSVTEEKRLYENDLSHLGAVDHIAAIRSPSHPEKFIVQFSPSGDVYRFNSKIDQTPALIASATQSTPGLPPISELALEQLA